MPFFLHICPLNDITACRYSEHEKRNTVLPDGEIHI